MDANQHTIMGVMMIRHWKIRTNLVHDPIAVVNRLNETIMDLTNIEWTKQTMLIADMFIDAHNECIDKLNAISFPDGKTTERLAHEHFKHIPRKGKEIKTTAESSNANIESSNDCTNPPCNNQTVGTNRVCIECIPWPGEQCISLMCTELTTRHNQYCNPCLYQAMCIPST